MPVKERKIAPVISKQKKPRLTLFIKMILSVVEGGGTVISKEFEHLYLNSGIIRISLFILHFPILY